MDKNEQTILTGIFNVKTITSAGGILIALVLVYFIGKILTNELPHIQRAVEEQTRVMEKVLRDNTKAIESNTEILRIIERRLK
mgnify:FL=1